MIGWAPSLCRRNRCALAGKYHPTGFAGNCRRSGRCGWVHRAAERQGQVCAKGGGRNCASSSEGGSRREAWSAINAVDENRPAGSRSSGRRCVLSVMEALGRKVDAQAFRWQCFERTLSSDHLRSYLKRMPDFEEIEAEERAMSYALGFPNLHQALVFLVSWPSLDKAAKLAVQRAAELNGDHYEILTPAADALAGKHLSRRRSCFGR